MKRIILFACSFICTLSLYSQTPKVKVLITRSNTIGNDIVSVDTIFRDYYVKDSVLNYGDVIVDNGSSINSQYCEVWVNGTTLTKFSPNEINEYKFYQGRVYVAKDIRLLDSVRRVFLERIISGKLTLYYYEDAHVKTYFVEKDSSDLIELPKKSNLKSTFRDKLLLLTSDCENVKFACNVVSYNDNSLARLVKNYNNNIDFFPYSNFGVFIGWEHFYFRDAIDQQVEIKVFDSYNDNSILYGVFYQRPFLNSLYSIRYEIQYVKHSFAMYTRKENVDYDFIGNYTSIKLPIILSRGININNKSNLAINLGLLGIYNFQNNSEFYKTLINYYVITTEKIDTHTLHNNFLMGFTCGTAYKYNVGRRSNLFCELRYNSNYNDFFNKQFRGFSSINLLTGITF